tara:strand:+ start:995 stop:1381 length:387 start_codon:yes stop_codon:yes gene_type:complete
MSKKFSVEIISPDRSILKTQASEVTIPSYEGEIGILTDHIPIITFLRPGLVKIQEDTQKIYYIEEGTVEFSNNNLLILTSTARKLSDLDKRLLSQEISEAQQKISGSEISDKQRYLLSYKIETLKNIN